MLRIQDTIGLPVFEIESGKQLGTVKDVLLNKDWAVQGFLLDIKHWFSAPRFVGLQDVRSVGEDAVTVTDENAICLLEDMTHLHSFIHGSHKLRGQELLTEDGCHLGTVDDVYFPGNMGTQIIGFELTNGILSDLQDGRKWLPLPEQAEWGKDAIIVPSGTEGDLEDIVPSTKE